MQKLLLNLGLGMLLAVSGIQTSMAKEPDQAYDQAMVTIGEPADGAVLVAQKPVKLNYKATLGPKGNHLRLYIDKMQAAVLTQPAGDHVIRLLSPGLHKINLEILDKDNHPIGVGKEITVDVRY